MNEKNVKIISSGVVGPAKKRDIGFNHSSGEIIVFLDDDSYPAKNFFNIAKELFRKKKVSVVGGPGMTPLKSSISEKLFNFFLKLFRRRFSRKILSNRKIKICRRMANS